MGALACLGAVTTAATSARAQDRELERVEVETYQAPEGRVAEVEAYRAPEAQVDAHDARPRYGFVEATGAYGVQFGETDYLPAGAVGDWQHPIVHGFGVGGTAGVVVLPGLALIANYEYANARSRTGSLDGVIEEVQGEISYHTITAGARLWVPLPFGAVQGEMAFGVVLPYETELNVQYGAGLAPAGIAGAGRRIDEYSVGFGGHALLGYLIPIGDVFYTALNVKLRTFEAENSGERTRLTNFVTDFEAQPPTATTADIRYGDGAARPVTNSVQDVRLQLALGARF